MPDQRKAPNDLLRRARLRLPSPSGSGRAMSRQELAEAVNAWLFADTGRVFRLDETYIGKLERGEHRWPNERYRAALRAVLGATDAQLGFHTGRGSPMLIIDTAASGRAGGELLGGDTWDEASAAALAAFLAHEDDLGPDEAMRLSHEWRVVDPPQIVELRSGRRVGRRLAAMVTERADMLRRMDDFLGGGDMHDLVRRELRVTVDMVRSASYTEATGKLLLAAVGELCQLAGWVASDAGLTGQAERYYLGGVSAAHAAQDNPLAANLLSSLAYQKANVADPREAVLLASSAYHGAKATATATTRALLLERVAWANARFGDAQAALRALGEVEDAYANTDPSADPAWVYWLNRDEIDVMAGRCLTQLRRPVDAIPLLAAAVDRYDDTHARELSLYLSWLAEAHIDAGHIDEAAHLAARCLTLSTGVTSARGTERVQLLRRLLVRHHGNGAVDAFADQAAAVLGPPGTG
ncbi:hypothetical protein [Micromonospora sp. WMMD1082]|uniref:hypothetical protein n=1 Tax=Micromonospora sp. WMMD1082 TaxID=3016104 RepID=UPI002416D1BB|nr:hypothetical protein [Micromonospora sp. WMMD1082]MDG4793648.1 hypothetical protein [Micromonospora sp. WMMD1082]